MAQQSVRRRPPLLLHKHLPQEVPAGVGHALGQRGLRGLRGNLENGRHGFVLGPRRLLGQHLHDSAGHTPEDTQGSLEDSTATFLFVRNFSKTFTQTLISLICVKVQETGGLDSR